MSSNETNPLSDDSLAAALKRHDIELPDEQVQRLDHYCRLLWEWNTRLNLTRHSNYETFVARDVVDARHLAQQLAAGERVLDVGTGGGLPGIVLAILRADLRVTLSESVGKKARAVEQMVGQLGLEAAVHHGRAEEVLARHRQDSLVVRAVAPLAKLLGWFAPHWDSFGRLLVIKGPAWVQERYEARRRHLLDGLQLRKLESWPLPGSSNQSVLLEIRPST